MTTTSIDLLLPAGASTFTVGSGGVTNITVSFYFANVVFVKVYYNSGAVDSFYQIPCVLHQIP